MILDIYTPTVYKNIKTTKGRIIFNKQLPKNYESKFGFVNEPVTKKVLKKVLKNVYLYFNNHFMETINNLKMIGITYGTIYNKSIPLNDLELPEGLKKEIKELQKLNDPIEISNKISELSKKYQDYLRKIDSSFLDLINSGAAKNKIEPMVIAKGTAKDIKGDTITFKNSFAEGFTPIDYFKSGNIARGGLADRVLNTSHTGYLERKLVYAANSVILDKNKKDCKTDKTFDIIFNKNMYDLLLGRYVVHNDELMLLNPDNIKMFSPGERISLRSPIYCQNKDGICKTCYGKLSEKTNTEYIGVLAAQTIGERGSQAIMKSFHTGGVIEWRKVNIYDLLSRFNHKYTVKQLNQFIKQQDYEIYTNVDLKIIFDKKEIKDKIDYENNSIKLDLCDFYTVDIFKNILYWNFDEISTVYFDKLNEEDEYYVIDKKKNDLLLKITPSASGVHYNYLRQIFEQTIPSKNEHQLYYRIMDAYNQIGDIDSIHIECLVSNMCRDPEDINRPYRLRNNYDVPPKIVSIKELPYLTDASLGLFFENPQKALEYGLIQDESERSAILDLIERV